MVLMLVHLQDAAVIFRVGRHHHHGPLCEGRGLTHAHTDTPPTDLTRSQRTHRWVPSHSLTAPCAIHAAGGPAVASSTFMLDLPKLACPSCSLKSSRSSRPPPSRCRRLCSGSAPRAASAAFEIENGECEDVGSRVSLCSDSTGIYSTHGRRWPARGLTPFQIWC